MKTTSIQIVAAVVLVGATCLTGLGMEEGNLDDPKADTRPLPTKVHHSSDFGWEAGQDVTEPFAELLKSGKVKAGEELVLDHTYRISGSHRMGRKRSGVFIDKRR